MKKQTDRFYVGKGIKGDERLTPLKGAPNTNLDIYNKATGRLIQRRKYNKKGRAAKDYDVGHGGHNENDHRHDYNNNDRSPARELTKKEQRELDKAKKKRRFW